MQNKTWQIAPEIQNHPKSLQKNILKSAHFWSEGSGATDLLRNISIEDGCFSLVGVDSSNLLISL